MAVEGAQLDGMVCLASCDKTVPGQLMAAGRLNIPTIVVPCGYQPSGTYRGEHIDIEDVWLNAARRATGTASFTTEDLREMSEQRHPRPGRLRRDGNRQLDAHRDGGARHGASRHDPGARQ